MRLLWLACSLCWVLPAGASDALSLLGRAVSTAQRLSFSGTFVYQHGGHTETSRITHVVDGGREFEHLEVLDGSPREVIREGDEVKCYFPDSRTVFIEKKSEHRVFPALLPASLAGLTDHYQVQQTGMARVAGYETQRIVLTPRDEFRYGHQFWVDPVSGLTLKAVLSNDHHEVLESFAFTELKIGGTIGRDALRPRQTTTEDWKVVHGATRDGRGDDVHWVFRNLPAGFVRTSGMKRQLHLSSPEARHYIFSDGLASVSVFIEPLSRDKPRAENGLRQVGALHAYRRVVGEHQITVMGEVPATAVRRIGDGVEVRRKP